MTCNGNNHDLFCPCDFRGGNSNGLVGRNIPLRRLLLKNLSYSSLDGSRYESYLDLNAKCPECGDPVIFYRSPYNGRVFFDPPPGYPWPKHPCTDSRLKQAVRVVPKYQNPSLKDFAGDWFIFQHSKPISALDYGYLGLVLGDEYIDVTDNVHLAAPKLRVIATEIVGQLVILRRKRQIKIIKSTPKVATALNTEYEYNDEYQLTLRIYGNDSQVSTKIWRLRNCAISAQLNSNDKSCTLICVPLGSDENDNERFELTATVTRIKTVKTEQK